MDHKKGSQIYKKVCTIEHGGHIATTGQKAHAQIHTFTHWTRFTVEGNYIRTHKTLPSTLLLHP